jgi:hypothetical protein
MNISSAAAVLGRRGGLAKSDAKAEASRINANMPPKPGKKPRGRPRKQSANSGNLVVDKT